MRTVVTTLLKPDRPTEPAAWSDRAPPPDRPTEPAAWSDHAPPPDRPTEPAASSDRASPPDRPRSRRHRRTMRHRQTVPRSRRHRRTVRHARPSHGAGGIVGPCETETAKAAADKERIATRTNLFVGKILISKTLLFKYVFRRRERKLDPLRSRAALRKAKPQRSPADCRPRQPTSVDRTDLFSTMRGKGDGCIG